MECGEVVFRCIDEEKRLTLSERDAHLLDGEYFLVQCRSYRPLFGLDFVRGMGAPPLNTVLKTHGRGALLAELQGLLNTLEDQKDLITYSYQFAFSGGPAGAAGAGGGAVSGFQVDGLHGSVTNRPSGYCHVTLSEVAPTGRGRIVQIIDMRARRELQTDNWGILKIVRRKAKVGWYDQLPGLIAWLKSQKGKEVQVLHG